MAVIMIRFDAAQFYFGYDCFWGQQKVIAICAAFDYGSVRTCCYAARIARAALLFLRSQSDLRICAAIWHIQTITIKPEYPCCRGKHHKEEVSG